MNREIGEHILKIGQLNDTLYYVGCGIGKDKNLSSEEIEGVLLLINGYIEKEINEILNILDEYNGLIN